MTEDPTISRLSIRRLTLTGFVVDADPLILWFDPSKLRVVNFKDNCVDAGFYLSTSMQGRTAVVYPRQGEETAVAVPARRVDLKNELKIIELRDAKKVIEKPYRAKQKWDLTLRRKRRDFTGNKNDDQSGREGMISLSESQNWTHDNQGHELRSWGRRHTQSGEQ